MSLVIMFDNFFQVQYVGTYMAHVVTSGNSTQFA